MTFMYADENDCALILNFIRQLASYEKMSDQVVATEDLLREWIFEKRRSRWGVVADAWNGHASLNERQALVQYKIYKKHKHGTHSTYKICSICGIDTVLTVGYIVAILRTCAQFFR